MSGSVVSKAAWRAKCIQHRQQLQQQWRKLECTGRRNRRAPGELGKPRRVLDTLTIHKIFPVWLETVPQAVLRGRHTFVEQPDE